jgi:hypothetical protein
LNRLLLLIDTLVPLISLISMYSVESWIMDLFHRNKNICDQCGQKFDEYDELIAHAIHVHHHPIVKCHECGRQFIHEKDRLHHVREEHEKKIDRRTHKWEHIRDQRVNPQEQVDKQTKNFGDNF